MAINFPNLQNIFNSQINLLLSSSGLTTRCQLNFGISKHIICPNCIYDVNLKKSSNKYKNGGPVPFGNGKICPYCNGSGSYGEIHVEDIYLAVIWDYKKWLSPPVNLANPEGYVQTICSKSYLPQIRQCKDMTIVVNPGLANPVFSLYGEPNFAGLGDNNYIFCLWKKTGAQNVVKNILPATPTPTPTKTSTPAATHTPTPTVTSTITQTPTITTTSTSTPTPTPTPTTTATPTPTLTASISLTPTISITPSLTNTSTRTPTRTTTPTPTVTATVTPSPTPVDNYAVRSLNVICDNNVEPSGRLISWSDPIITSGINGYTIEYLVESCLFATGVNSANFNKTANWNGQYSGNLTSVGTNGGPGYYGTYDMNGNVFEWNDLDATATLKKGIRGGGWNNSSLMSFFNRAEYAPSVTNNTIGLRVASSNNEYNFSNFVYVGNINNNSNIDGYGNVDYAYYIGRYEVTNNEYCEFLNSIAKTDTYRVFPTGIPNSSTDPIRGIARSGVVGNYTYHIKPDMANKPANYITWFSAARYCNWLHNNKPSGLQTINTTESGAYYLNGINTIVARSSGAKYYIPTENEWYKAAYYRGGSTSAGYWSFATQSNNFPAAICANSSGNGSNCPSYSAPTTLGNNITITFSS